VFCAAQKRGRERKTVPTLSRRPQKPRRLCTTNTKPAPTAKQTSLT
jgi:hypothetical protein